VKSRIVAISSIALLNLLFSAIAVFAQSPGAADGGLPETQFNQLCAGCHGKGGAGGDRAPALTNNRDLRSRSQSQIADLIRNGTPGGMPAFHLPADQLQPLAAWVRSLNVSAFDAKPAGDHSTGKDLFFGSAQCATCHMAQGRGGTNGPDLSDIGRKSTVRELELVLENPTSQMGIHTTASCPPWAFCPDEQWAVVDVRMRDRSTMRGFARSRAEHDLALQTFDGKFHLLDDKAYLAITTEKQSYMPPAKAAPDQRRDLVAYLSTLSGNPLGPLPFEPASPTAAEIAAVMRPQAGEWPAYNGTAGGNRYSALAQINTGNAKNLQLEWLYSLESPGLETTPIVSDGIMYVTGPGKVCALNPSTGSEIWCYARPADPGQHAGRRSSDSQPNRGAAVLGDRIFFVTEDAHLICLNRVTGGVMWDVSMAEGPGRYLATAAPLVVNDLVISGVAGGDSPLRGFISAYKVTTGKLAWRFFTIPNPGEPASETWAGNALPTGGGATWLTGSYDADTGTLYWAVGNPFPATNGDERGGTNLYTNCVIAMEAKTGKLLWHYQFTPHDLHDWDATEPLVLANAKFKGRDRKLLLQANRNGFLYVLDRTNGELLLAKPFVKKLNWASGISADGKPQLLPANKPTKAGVKGCPAVRGATNWYSTAFNPATNLFYVMAVEDCSIYKQSDVGGYEGYRDPSDSGLKYLRAFDISTGEMVWEAPQVGPQEANYSGVLTTAGGLVFYGETGGALAAADAKTGKILWTFHANQPWKASPVTYTLNGRQYVAVASGGNILAFALNAANQ
jgi:PQQ-dependent dehydrogenase (methanol/ethanol family)